MCRSVWRTVGARRGVLAMVLISPGQRLLRLHFPPNFPAAPPANSRPACGPPHRLTGLRCSLRPTLLHFSRLPHFSVLDAPRSHEVSAHSCTAAVRQSRDVITHRKPADTNRNSELSNKRRENLLSITDGTKAASTQVRISQCRHLSTADLENINL